MLTRLNALRLRALNHPLVQLELRRNRRNRWLPGRRFFMLYPAMLGAVFGCVGAVVGSMILEGLSLPVSAFNFQMAALVTGLPAVCILSVATGLLSWVLAWIAPAFTAISIVQEREAGTFDLLRTTLLSEREIIVGKLSGALARLWPAMLWLMLLSPFQLIVGLFGGFFSFGSGRSPFLSLITLATLGDYENMSGAGAWVWLVIAALTGLLTPWADMLLHAAVGQIVSVAARSTGTAIAATYAAIIALRVGLYLLSMLLSGAAMLLLMAMVDMTSSSLPPAFLSNTMMISTTLGLLIVGIEFGGAALLLRGAVEWLKRS